MFGVNIASTPPASALKPFAYPLISNKLFINAKVIPFGSPVGTGEPFSFKIILSV